MELWSRPSILLSSDCFGAELGGGLAGLCQHRRPHDTTSIESSRLGLVEDLRFRKMVSSLISTREYIPEA